MPRHETSPGRFRRRLIDVAAQLPNGASDVMYLVAQRVQHPAVVALDPLKPLTMLALCVADFDQQRVSLFVSHVLRPSPIIPRTGC